MRVREKFTKQLLVEENDDQHVVWALCQRFEIEETFDVIDCEGVDNLLNQVPVRTKQSGIEAIGIVIDADSNISTRWQTISILLTRLGCVIPHDIPKTGLIVSNDDMKFGVWIMPNN